MLGVSGIILGGFGFMLGVLIQLQLLELTLAGLEAHFWGVLGLHFGGSWAHDNHANDVADDDADNDAGDDNDADDNNDDDDDDDDVDDGDDSDDDDDDHDDDGHGAGAGAGA
eukprot:10797524-Karenia_brevis.AAC.1